MLWVGWNRRQLPEWDGLPEAFGCDSFLGAGLARWDLIQGTRILFGGGGCAEVASLDVEGDGDVDLVHTNGGGFLYLSENDGSGDFLSDYLGSAWMNIDRIATGDIDGDGAPEVLVADPSAGVVRALTPATGADIVLPALSGRSPTLFDMDSDGDLDLVLSDQGGQTLQVLSNDGNSPPGFVPSAWLSGAAPAEEFVVGDLDGDGDGDLVSRATNLLHGHRWDGFQWNSQLLSGFSPDGPAGLAADFDGDGLDELVLYDSVSMQHHQPTQGWSSTVHGPVSWGIGGGTVADLDTDGTPEVVFAEVGLGDIKVSGVRQAEPVATSWTEAPLSYEVGGTLTAGDLDGDGVVELVSLNYGLLRVLVRGASGWSARDLGESSDPLPAGRPFIADLDGDGDPDVARVRGDGVLERFDNPGNLFDLWPVDELGTTGSSLDAGLALGDADGDGDVDLVWRRLSLDPLGYQLGWLRQDDVAGEWTSELIEADVFNGFVGVFDVDGDGDLDPYRLDDEALIVYEQGDGPSAGFLVATFPAVPDPVLVVPMELNGDGIPDLAIRSHDRSVWTMINASAPPPGDDDDAIGDDDDATGDDDDASDDDDDTAEADPDPVQEVDEPAVDEAAGPISSGCECGPTARVEFSVTLLLPGMLGLRRRRGTVRAC